MAVKPHHAVLVLVACVIACLCGCSGSGGFRSLPALVEVGVQSRGDTHQFHRGQGVIVGRRILTAAHTFLREGDQFPEERVILNGRSVPSSVAMHGDSGVVRSLYTAPQAPFADLLQDWVGFELPFTPQVGGGSWDLRVRSVQGGEKLFALRWNEAEGVVEDAPLEVLEGTADEPLPDRLVFVANTTNRPLAGWSGCFVGSYASTTHRWEFVGILLAGKEFSSERYHVVLRPSAETLRWLMSE